MLRTVLALAVSILSTACSINLPPIQSGKVLDYERGAVVQRWALSAAASSDVSAWLKSHRSGWTPTFVDYAPQLLALLNHFDGTRSSINVFPSSVIVVHEYREYAQHFGLPEIEALRRALGTGATANHRLHGTRDEAARP